MCRLVQRAILADDEEALERLMPYIKCLNAFILDEKGLLARKTVTHRTSRMTKAQADSIQVGDKYRLGMYVATATRRSAVDELREWQEGEMGGRELKYTWVFTIPKGCRQATKISSVSHYAKEHEVLLVPFSAILVTGKTLDRDSGMVEISADVLEDSNVLEDSPLDLPTAPA